MISLGRVAAGMAHEIRNPLTGINSYLYTLEDLCDLETLTPDNFQMIRKIVEQIQVASNKIESVIRRVMDFSKPGTPIMGLTDINTPVEEAINLSAVAMRQSGVKIKMDLSKDLPMCYADSQLIEQVILNLMNNAAKAMQVNEGSKMLEIRSSSKNNRIFLTVSDSGPGVPTKLRDKIFDPFVTTENDGSGIGLSIAQRIVADHNGSIRVGTSKWGGAEFKIELPIEKRMHPR
jgi:signal transduction histidine kinase